MLNWLSTIAKEPPVRLLSRQIVKCLPTGIETKSRWDAVARPQYLAGLVRAAREARSTQKDSFCAIEFGVAGGSGLVELERYAELVGREFGLNIEVVGFDAGSGLPSFCGDYRDHPDMWSPGDYKMDESALRRKILPSTRLIIGNIQDTLEGFICEPRTMPIGFVSFDLDLYSSTRDALKIFSHSKRQQLRRAILYFDDVHTLMYHHAAGEYLAISEFNQADHGVYIDKWHNVKIDRPFPEAFWTEKMYVAHDLEAISKVDRGNRPIQQLPLQA